MYISKPHMQRLHIITTLQKSSLHSGTMPLTHTVHVAAPSPNRSNSTDDVDSTESHGEDMMAGQVSVWSI